MLPTYHEIAHDERGEKDGHAEISVGAFLNAHAVPKWFDPLPAQNAENHQKCVIKVDEIPTKFLKSVNLAVI